MLLQYSSDIHCEFKDITQIPKLFKNINADVLILSGDICTVNQPVDFEKLIALLSYYSQKYKYIIMVSGNHEYYYTGSTPTKDICMDAVNRKLKALSKTFPNFIYLNCDKVTLSINKKSYTFIGATLWTKVNIKDRPIVETQMNDYDCIFMCKDNVAVKFTVADMQRLHSRHVLFIKKTVESLNGIKTPCILLTHHKPIGDTLELDRKVLTQAYESDITNIIVNPVRLAIHGHTHQHYDKTINGIRYVSNPVGYPNQHTKYQNDLGIEL